MLDLLVIVFAVSAAIGGYRLGFIARAVSWFGLIVGATVGALVLPEILPRMRGASDVTIVMIEVGALVGTALIGNALGLTLGSRLHVELPAGTPRRADQVAGGVLGVVGVLVVLWVLLPTLADVPGWTSEQARSSAIAREVSNRFPNPPNTLEALRRVVGEDPFPQVFDALRPAPDVGATPGSSGLSQETVDRVRRSTVKVEGQACNRIQEGSGFFVAPELVVTNAHVVAGEDDSRVELSDGSTVDARVVAFDPERDLAVLRVDGERPALPLRSGGLGDTGGVFGRPGGGPLQISPFRIGDKIEAVGHDIYDQGRTRRQVLVLASDLAPGDSGAALVDRQGEVLGVAFAIAPDKPGVAYALALDELRPVLAEDLSDTVDTGGCLA
jgi:S1-C subfamily serine protease